MKYVVEKIIVLIAFLIAWRAGIAIAQIVAGHTDIWMNILIAVMATVVAVAIKTVTWSTSAREFLISTELEYKKIEWPDAQLILSNVQYILLAVVVISGLTLFVDMLWQRLFSALGFLTLVA